MQCNNYSLNTSAKTFKNLFRFIIHQTWNSILVQRCTQLQTLSPYTFLIRNFVLMRFLWNKSTLLHGLNQQCSVTTTNFQIITFLKNNFALHRYLNFMNKISSGTRRKSKPRREKLRTPILIAPTNTRIIRCEQSIKCLIVVAVVIFCMSSLINKLTS